MAMTPFSSGINDVDRQTLRARAALDTTGPADVAYEDTGALATGLVKSLVIQVKVDDIKGGLTDLRLQVETALDAASTDWVKVPTQAISAGVVTPSDFTYTVASPADDTSYLTYISGATLGLFTRVRVQGTFGGAAPEISIYALRRQVA